MKLERGAVYEQELPASYNGFVYVIDGAVRVGDGDGTILDAGQVGWLDRPRAAARPDRDAGAVRRGEPGRPPPRLEGVRRGAVREDERPHPRGRRRRLRT